MCMIFTGGIAQASLTIICVHSAYIVNQNLAIQCRRVILPQVTAGLQFLMFVEFYLKNAKS